MSAWKPGNHVFMRDPPAPEQRFWLGTVLQASTKKVVVQFGSSDTRTFKPDDLQRAI